MALTLGAIAEGFYNGKLEEPILANRSLTPQERQALLDTATPSAAAPRCGRPLGLQL